MGFLSTFRSRTLAEKRALRLRKANLLDKPTIFKVRTEAIVDISPFAVFPEQGECVLPPCTYLDLRSEVTVMSVVRSDGDAENHVRHIEAAATLSHVE